MLYNNNLNFFFQSSSYKYIKHSVGNDEGFEADPLRGGALRILRESSQDQARLEREQHRHIPTNKVRVIWFNSSLKMLRTKLTLYVFFTECTLPACSFMWRRRYDSFYAIMIF